MNNNFVNQINNKYNLKTNVYDSIFAQYERVVVQSLITSFGLDFLVQDRYGGDVDTINNVRMITSDSNMDYKNAHNAEIYASRGDYDSHAYHSGSNFQQTKHDARELWQATGQPIKDEYTNQDIGFYGHTKSISPQQKAELDHIIAAKEIHDDRGRLLSGLDGQELTDSHENFAWTNKSLNASMQDKCITEYVASHPELDESTKQRLLERDSQAREAYNSKLNYAYYTSSSFFQDTAHAAMHVGVAMGLRQALGLVFSEIWFAIQDEIRNGKTKTKTIFNQIASGFKQGLENAKKRYKELWSKFIEGAISGVLSSITTTLCNIFFATSQNLIRIIRQTWASLVEATKILFFNPDDLPLGERLCSATKIIATGASVVAGIMVSDTLAHIGIGAIPVLGGVIQTFCGTLVTGILSCSLLYLLDHNGSINKLVQILNSVFSVENQLLYYKEQARLLEEYGAKLMDLDLETFKRETQAYNKAVTLLDQAIDQQELNSVLHSLYKELNLKSPFGQHKDLDSFMADPNSVLSFS